MATFTIETDNRTTWINLDGRLVGRICPISAEVVNANDDVRANKLFVGTPTETFNPFCRAIKEEYGIDVPEKARPQSLTLARSALKTVLRVVR